MKDLIIEYMNRIGRDLSFRHLDEELADLAGQYTAPEGDLLAAVEDGTDGIIA